MCIEPQSWALGLWRVPSDGICSFFIILLSLPRYRDGASVIMYNPPTTRNSCWELANEKDVIMIR